LDSRLVAALEPEADVARRGRVHLRRIRAQGIPRIDHRRQHLVVHFDRIGGVLRLRAGLGDHGRQRLADVVRRAAREREAVRLRHRLAVGRLDRPQRRHRADLVGRHVGAGQHRDNAGQGGGAGDIDAADTRMGVRRAHQHAMQFARQHQVGDEAAPPAQELGVFDAQHRRADALVFQIRAYCSSSRSRSRR
jgi:hypothetical protein